MHSVNKSFPLTIERMFYIMRPIMSGSLARFRSPRRRPRRRSVASPTLGPYSQYFTSSECELLRIFPAADALSEIHLLRVLVARTLAASRRWGGLDLPAQAALLSALARTAANIAALSRLRVQILSPSDDPVLKALAALGPDDL
jgi:hypothetical protein